jgi:predicted outer membrane repeat protein
MTDVTVSGNNCNVDGSFGGGIVMNYSEATMTNVTVTDNTASFGGGVSVGNSDATLTHVTISGNTATTSGGGFLSTPYSNNKLTNSIIWDNSPESIFAFITTTISYSDIQGGWNGEGNIDTDPLFTDAGNGDHTLQPDSPCIDAGTADLDGDGIEDITDYVGLAPDMGAFEYGSTASVNDPNELPQKFALHQNYPNPFNPITTLRYNLPENGLVNITIYDIMGRVVKTLINGSQTAGYKTIQWNATNDRNEQVSAGLYLYTIQAGEFRQTKKMVLLK